MRPFMMFAPPTKLSPPGIPCNARAGLLKIVLATYGISTARPALMAKPLIVLSNFWAANFLSTVTATTLVPALKGVATTAATLEAISTTEAAKLATAQPALVVVEVAILN